MCLYGKHLHLVQICEVWILFFYSSAETHAYPKTSCCSIEPMLAQRYTRCPCRDDIPLFDQWQAKVGKRYDVIGRVCLL